MVADLAHGMLEGTPDVEVCVQGPQEKLISWLNMSTLKPIGGVKFLGKSPHLSIISSLEALKHRGDAKMLN